LEPPIYVTNGCDATSKLKYYQLYGHAECDLNHSSTPCPIGQGVFQPSLLRWILGFSPCTRGHRAQRRARFSGTGHLGFRWCIM